MGRGSPEFARSTVPDLTDHLDGLGSQPFAQDVINEIVLGK
jgi:hypothetical protein